jgi:hypothetical protein
VSERQVLGTHTPETPAGNPPNSMMLHWSRPAGQSELVSQWVNSPRLTGVGTGSRKIPEAALD